MGLAKPMSQVKGTCCGTLLYMAPEVFQQLPCETAADIYSVGILLWEIWNAKRAYSGDTLKLSSISDFIEGVTNGTLRPNNGKFAVEDDTSHRFQMRARKWGDIARKCWSSVPDKRLSVEEASKAIADIS